MKKKIIFGICGALLSALLIGVVPFSAKAALPCSIDIMNDAANKINANQAALAQVNADLVTAQNTYNALVASGTATPLEIQQAADLITNLTNQAKWWTDQVNNSKAYLLNILNRAEFEDTFAMNRLALADLTKLQQAKQEADGAAEIANGALNKVNMLQKEIANYQSQVAEHPEFQVQIDQLNAELVKANADYAAKLKVANDKIALYNYYSQTLMYGFYNVGFENYQYNREINRPNTAWNPAGYY